MTSSDTGTPRAPSPSPPTPSRRVPHPLPTAAPASTDPASDTAQVVVDPFDSAVAWFYLRHKVAEVGIDAVFNTDIVSLLFNGPPPLVDTEALSGPSDAPAPAANGHGPGEDPSEEDREEERGHRLVPPLSLRTMANLKSLHAAKAKRMRSAQYRQARRRFTQSHKLRAFTMTGSTVDVGSDTVLSSDGTPPLKQPTRDTSVTSMFKLFSLIDSDGSGVVDAAEFVRAFEGAVDPTFRRWIASTTGNPRDACDTLEGLRSCLLQKFDAVDANGDRAVSVLEFRTMFRAMCEDVLRSGAVGEVGDLVEESHQEE